MDWIKIKNNGGAVALADVPQLDYVQFFGDMKELMADQAKHIGHYFGVTVDKGLMFYCVVLDDASGQLLVASHLYDYYCEEPLESLTTFCIAAHPFEREIAELYGVVFRDSKWNKPLRFAAERVDRSKIMETYPFYHVASESLHEVNVGPIHAGVIEPGAFRFICNGERVHHLEIALGYQHRGIEPLLCGAEGGLLRSLLAESVAGDSAVSNSLAHVGVVEQLTGSVVSVQLQRERTIAAELERIAIHIGDTGALCMDIGYQLGQVACEALRTVVINTSQVWCGNRFGKGLVRPHGTNFPLSEDVIIQIEANMADVRRRYNEVRHNLTNTPSVLARLEECGVVGRELMLKIGGVGLAARASGVVRDIRKSHPYVQFGQIEHTVVVKEFGDVMSRLSARIGEVLQSIDYVDHLLSQCESTELLPRPDYDVALKADSLAVSLVEGWRGELCHVALTDLHGAIKCYKIKDPSLHNWLALALALRDEGISDFPICNKSFNLSYCGHDL